MKLSYAWNDIKLNTIMGGFFHAAFSFFTSEESELGNKNKHLVNDVKILLQNPAFECKKNNCLNLLIVVSHEIVLGSTHEEIFTEIMSQNQKEKEKLVKRLNR